MTVLFVLFFLLGFYLKDIGFFLRENFYNIRICNNSNQTIDSSTLGQYSFGKVTSQECSKFLKIGKINGYEELIVGVTNNSHVGQNLFTLGVRLNSTLIGKYTINIKELKGKTYKGILYKDTV